MECKQLTKWDAHPRTIFKCLSSWSHSYLANHNHLKHCRGRGPGFVPSTAWNFRGSEEAHCRILVQQKTSEDDGFVSPANGDFE